MSELKLPQNDRERDILWRDGVLHMLDELAARIELVREVLADDPGAITQECADTARQRANRCFDAVYHYDRGTIND